MANKYPWFAHRNDAHEDLFLQSAMARFGHFGYASYFILLEVFDRHGSGDVLEISPELLAQKMRTKPKSARNVLGMFRESGKIKLADSGEILRIEIPNFRKFQSKRKSKVPSKYPQSSTNVPTHNNNNNKNINRTNTTDLGAKTRAKVSPVPRKNPDTPFHRFMDRVMKEYFRAPIGVDTPAAKAEVKALYARYGKAGRDIVALAGSDDVLAYRGLTCLGEHFDREGLSWTLDTVAKRFAEWKSNPKEFERNENRRF